MDKINATLVLIKETPVPTFLIIIGAIFLLIGLLTLDKPITINLKPQDRTRAMWTGTIILISGIGLYTLPFFIPPSNSPPQVSITPTTALVFVTTDVAPLNTQTPDLKPSPTETPLPANTPDQISTSIIVEDPTSTPLPPSPTPSPTPTTILGGNNCISASLWTTFQGYASPVNLDGCWLAEKHGLFTDNNLTLNVKDLTAGKLYGVYTSIPTTTEIKFSIAIEKLVTQNDEDGNIVFAIVPRDSIAPTLGVALLFQVETSPPYLSPVLLKVHERNKPQTLISNLPVYQLRRTYNFRLRLTTSALYIYLNDEQVAGPISVSFPDRILWIGYTVPEGGELLATISDLTISGK